MIAPLPRRVALVSGEPSDSLLHRLSTRWRMSREEFERFLGFDRSTMLRGAHAGPLASLSGSDPAALAAASPRRLDGTRRIAIGAAWTDLSDTAGRRLRLCGACLGDDRRRAAAAGDRVDLAAWSRPHWSIRSIATCGVHDALLTTRCPACCKTLDGRNPSIDVCACGKRLPETEVRFHSDVDALLAGLIDGTSDPDLESDAGLHHISAHLTRLGAVALGWAAERPQPEGLELLSLRDDGLRMLRRGEAGLRDALDSMLVGAPGGNCGRPGVTSAYGWVWRSWLGVPSANPLDVRLRDAVLRHASDHGLRSHRDASDVTLAEAGDLLGAGHARTRRIVVGAGLLRGEGLPGVAMAVDAVGVADVAAELAGLMDAAASAAFLGVGRQRFRDLVRGGLVAPCERAARIGAGVLYSRCGLRGLVARCAGDAPLVGRPPVGCMPLPVACRDASVPLAVLLQALLEGGLRVVARTAGDGLDRLWASVPEVARLAEQAPSVRGAARALGLHYEAARWLAARGLLGRKPGSVDPASIAAFGAAFCTSAQLGLMISLPSRAAITACRGRGLHPVFAPPECRQAIWSREAVGVVFGVGRSRAG